MATYDPSKRYTWTPNDKFEFTGAEFGLILNAFRAVLNTEEARALFLANEANQAVERALAAAVEADVVKEVPEESKQANL